MVKKIFRQRLSSILASLFILGASFLAHAGMANGSFDKAGQLSLYVGETRFFSGPVYVVAKLELPDELAGKSHFWCVRINELEKEARSFRARFVGGPNDSYREFTVQVPESVQLIAGSDGVLVLKSGNHYFGTGVSNQTNSFICDSSMWGEEKVQATRDCSDVRNVREKNNPLSLARSNSMTDAEAGSTDEDTASCQLAISPRNQFSLGEGPSSPLTANEGTDGNTSDVDIELSSSGITCNDGNEAASPSHSQSCPLTERPIVLIASNHSVNEEAGDNRSDVIICLPATGAGDNSALSLSPSPIITTRFLEDYATVLKIAVASSAVVMITALAIKIHNEKKPEKKIGIAKHAAIAGGITALAATLWCYWHEIADCLNDRMISHH